MVQKGFLWHDYNDSVFSIGSTFDSDSNVDAICFDFLAVCNSEPGVVFGDVLLFLLLHTVLLLVMVDNSC